MKWFSRRPNQIGKNESGEQSNERLAYDGIALLLLKQTSDAVRNSSQTLKKQLDVGKQSKLLKIETELLYFNVFALDYWIQKSTTYSLEKQRLIRGAFHTHLANMVSKDTVQQRFFEYGQIINKATSDTEKLSSLGMKLSEYCGMPSFLFLIIAPDLFKRALETVSIIESGVPNSKLPR